MHPLTGDLTGLSDTDLDEKSRTLRKRLFMTRDPNVYNQLTNLLNDYEEELRRRTAESMKRMQEDGDNDLDGLINIS